MNKKGIQLLCFLFFSAVVFAQEDSGKKWTLRECIDYAIAHNITIKSADLTKQSAEADYKQSKLNRLPDLSGAASQSFTNGNSIDPITSDYVSKQINSTNVGINTSVTLFQGKQITNQIKQNKLLVDQNSFFVEEAKNNVVLSLVEAYLQALYDQEDIEIAQNNINVSKKEEARAKAQYHAGAIPIKDYTDAQSQTATNQYNLITAKNNYAQQIVTLKQLLELAPDEDFQISDPEDINTIVSEIPNKTKVYQKALGIMPEISASAVDVSIAKKDLDIAKGGFLPTLTLGGSVGTGYTSSQDLNFSDQFNVNFNQRLSLSLNIPIFSKGQNKTNVTKATIGIAQAQIAAQTAKKDLYKKIETAWQNAASAEEQLSAAKAAQDAAEQSFNLAQKQSELGALSTTDLVVSQNTYINAQQNYIQAKYLHILYTQLLQFYQGNSIKL
ncbi:TolC family protein [Zhouia sp. PK063]|uniref:TolC family protein n=1 Tax=Zhouia sp. PK063 TaxID=3373602 RepID=UPI0037A36CFF